MARYYFHLHTGDAFVRDRFGTELEDDAAARDHASAVARDLMRRREDKTRHWQLTVRDANGGFCFELVFAAADETIELLRPPLRHSLESMYGAVAHVSGAIGDLRTTVMQVRSTLAKADRIVHLAAIDGEQL